MEENVGTCFMSFGADTSGNVMHCVEGIAFWNYEHGMNLEDYGINRAIDVCRAWDPVNKRCGLVPEITYNVLNLTKVKRGETKTNSTEGTDNGRNNS